MLTAVKGKETSAASDRSAIPEKNDDGKASKKDLLGGLLSAVTGGDTRPEPLPDWRTAPTSLVSSPPVRIPLRVSLQMIYVGTDRTLGDFESVFKVDT